MTTGDIVGLVASYLYAFGLLFAVEGLGKRLGWPQFVTRKLTHIGAGMWLWGLLALFSHWTWGLIPFGTFVVLNYVFYRRQSFAATDGEHTTPGTVYFALSITILLAGLWRTGGGTDRVALAAAAVMAMTWGDALASLIGQRWGRHRYTVLGHTRSWEGSAAMAAATFAVVGATLLLVPGSPLSPHGAAWTLPWVLAGAATATAIATAAEAVSPAGTDNLSVPLLTGLALLGVEQLATLGG